MSQQSAKVLVDMEVRSKTDGINKAKEELKGFQGVLQRLKSAATERLGFGAQMQLESKAVDKIFEMLGAIKDAFAGFVKEGIQFNSMVEMSQVSLAAVLRNSQPERFKTLADAVAKARDMFKELRDAAVETGFTIDQATRVYAASTGIMTQAGIPLDRQIKTISLLMRATRASGLNSDIQLLQETRAIMMGESLRGALVATNAGMTTTGLKKAKSEGTLESYINEHLQGYVESQGALAKTFDVLISKINVLRKELAGLFTKEMFDSFKMIGELLVKVLNSETMRRLMTIAGKIANSFISSTILQLLGAGGLSGNIAAMKGIEERARRNMGLPPSKDPRDSKPYEGAAGEMGENEKEFLVKSWDDTFSDWMRETERRAKALDARMQSVFSAIVKQPAMSGLASRGLYGTDTLSRYYSATENVQQKQLDALLQVRDLLRSGIGVKVVSL